jgi:hypothetical protein
VLVATWTDDAALDQFLATTRLAEKFASGWHVRLAPIRGSGQWPGLDSDVPRERRPPHTGPVAVLTLGQLRMSRAVAFFRASALAEAQLLQSPGLVWATGMGKPPFVGTYSLWSSSDTLRDFAYGDPTSGHGRAMASDHHDAFHHVSAFVRFQPYGWVGSLTGRNPLPEHLAGTVVART